MKSLRRLCICSIVIMLSLAMPARLLAQKNLVQPSPRILNKPAAWGADSLRPSSFIVFSTDQLPSILTNRPFHLQSRGNGIYLIHATPFDTRQWLQTFKGNVYWDEQVKPSTEAGVINYDMTVNRVTKLWQGFPQMDGREQTVSVKEDRPDTNDIDLLGKYRRPALASTLQDNHATIMSTLIAGAGNSSFRGKGVAYASWYSSSDFTQVLPDTVTYYRGGNIQVQNHSYGTGIQNYYGINARAFDQSALDDTSLLHVISAGNSGTAAGSEGSYAGLNGFANITGNFKQAKNVLLVGAQLTDGSVPAFSSRGPLYDGRIAPHLVAFGDDGTSGAAALVSGTALLMQQRFKQDHGRAAGNALLKAILINTTRERHAQGPDYQTGFGSLDAEAALQSVVSGSFVEGVVSRGEGLEFDIYVEPDAQEFRLTLVWNDPPSAPGATQSLLNNLDLEVINQQTNEIIYPWTLAPSPVLDSLNLPAVRKRDSVNNVEQVSIDLPTAGWYRARIVYRSGSTSRQSFSLAYRERARNIFSWDFPLAGDQWVSGDEQWLRWTADAPGTDGVIEMSSDNGNNWQLVKDGINTDAGQFAIQWSDTMKTVRFRMRTGSLNVETADNMVAPSRAVRFGLVCDTATLLYWNRIPAAQAYAVYQLQGSQMVKVLTTADSSSGLGNARGTVFAMAGIWNGREGIRGQAVDYRNQPVGCYINRFFAGPKIPDGASIVLDLGTVYNVAGIEIIKRSDNHKLLLQQKPGVNLSYTVDDLVLHPGRNVYQAIVTLGDGTKILSDEQVVYYLGSRKHILFPNPLAQGQPMYLLSELTDDLQTEIIDLNGRLVKRLVITENLFPLPIGQLPRGMYVLRIHEADGAVQRYSLIIR